LQWLSDEGLAPGVHRLQMVATLADGSELKSNEIEVDLSCTHCDIDQDVDRM
jgi:hypothetical protein